MADLHFQETVEHSEKEKPVPPPKKNKSPSVFAIDTIKAINPIAPLDDPHSNLDRVIAESNRWIVKPIPNDLIITNSFEYMLITDYRKNITLALTNAMLDTHKSLEKQYSSRFDKMKKKFK